MKEEETRETEAFNQNLSKAQTDILDKCIASGFDISAMKDGIYSHAQMEQVYFGFLDGIDITDIINKEFSPLQLKEIREGLRDGLSREQVLLYSRTNRKNNIPVFASQQMKIIKQVLLAGLNPSDFLHRELSAADMEKQYRKLIPKQKEDILRESGLFNEEQLKVLTEAIAHGFDTKQIENPDYQPKQMQEYLFAKYENHLRDDQLMILSNPAFQAGQMREIRLGYTAGINAGTYANPCFSEAQMMVLREGKTSGIDISAFVTPNYTAMQMQVITDALKCGISTDILERIIHSQYSASQMTVMVEAALSGYDITRYVKESMSPDTIQFLYQAMRKGLKSSELRQIANTDVGYYEMQKKLNQILRSRENMNLFLNLRFGMLFRNLWKHFLSHMKLHYANEELYIKNKLPAETDAAARAFQFNFKQLHILEEALHRGIDVKDFGNPSISPEKMRLLMEAKAKGMDISFLSDPDFLIEQLVFCIRELEDAQKQGYDIQPVIQKQYHVSQMQELISAIKNGIDITDLLTGDYPANYLAQKKMEQIEEESGSSSGYFTSNKSTKETNDMKKNSKTLFGPATERKLPFEEQIRNAELKRDQQISNHRREKSKEQEQAVI